MRSWSKCVIFSRKRKSSIKVGPRSPALSELWLSFMRVLGLVLRPSPAHSSVFFARSSSLSLFAPYPALVGRSVSGLADFFLASSDFAPVFLLLMFYPLPIFSLSVYEPTLPRQSCYAAGRASTVDVQNSTLFCLHPIGYFPVLAFFALAASTAVLTSLTSSGGGSTAFIPSACIHSSRVQPLV